MNSRLLVASTILAFATVAPAQDETKIKRASSTQASATILKARAVAEVRNSAATVQFAAIKLTLASMLADFQSRHSLVAAAEDETKAVVYRTGEDEILRQVAKQLKSFIDTYPTAPEAQAARSILARVYVRLQRVDDAADVMKTFDPDSATTQTILQVALAAPEIAAVATKVAPMLQAAVVATEDVDQQVDAVFVAVRLGMKTVAVDLLARVEKSATSVEARAALLLAEAQLVARLARPQQIPLTRSNTVRSFVVSPLSAQLMSPHRVPANQWADVVAVEDGAFVKAKPVDTSDTGTTHTEKASSANYRAAAIARLEFVKSPLYDAVSVHARPGVRALHAWARFSGQSAPTADVEGPLRVDTVVAGLLHRVIYQYPGTKAARIATQRLHAESVSRGQNPVPIEGQTIDGQPVSLDSLSAANKVVIVDFWSTGDTASLLQRPMLAELHQNFRHRGLEILSVCLDTAEDEWLVRKAISHFGMDWPVIFEGTGAHSDIARSWGIDVLPALVVIGSVGAIFEDRPDRLTPAKIQDVVQDALRARLADLEVGETDPELKKRPLVVGTEPEPSLPTERLAPPPTHDWVGPPMTVKLEVMESTPKQYAVVVDTHSPAPGYRFVHERTRTVGPCTEVYISLVAPTATDMDAKRIAFRPVDTRIALGARVADTVKVFARRTIQGAQYFVEPEFTLISVRPVRADARRVYVGPDIRTVMVEPDGGGKIIICRVAVPNPAYVFAVDSIRQQGDVTQVLLRLQAPTVAVESAGNAQVKKLEVKLGATPAKTVEVLVDFRRARAPGDAQYALAATVKVH